MLGTMYPFSPSSKHQAMQILDTGRPHVHPSKSKKNKVAMRDQHSSTTRKQHVHMDVKIDSGIASYRPDIIEKVQIQCHIIHKSVSYVHRHKLCTGKVQRHIVTNQASSKGQCKQFRAIYSLLVCQGNPFDILYEFVHCSNWCTEPEAHCLQLHPTSQGYICMVGERVGHMGTASKDVHLTILSTCNSKSLVTDWGKDTRLLQ
jgi:hypothetical protein